MYSSKQPTYFIHAYESIEKICHDYKIASENCSYPTIHHFGNINDRYYAEIWKNGMDWQSNYWILESDYGECRIIPLLIFDDHADTDLFHPFEFGQLLQAIMWYRRDQCWMKNDEKGLFNDTVWPYVFSTGFDERVYKSNLNEFVFQKFFMEHYSQDRVDFFVNEEFIPFSIKNKTKKYK